MEKVVLAQLLLQVGLLLGPLPGLRVAFRVATFALGLLMLAVLRGRGSHHPAARFVAWVMIIMAVSLLHPLTSSSTASLAQFALYLAVLSPILWVTRLDVTEGTLRRTVCLLWGFGSLSAILGILQVWFPGYLQPPLSPIYSVRSADFLAGLQIISPSGIPVFRPMGLSDQPGGAAVGGFYAVVLGLGLSITSGRRALRVAGRVTAVIGLACVLLTHVRVFAVLSGLCLLVLPVVLMGRAGAKDTLRVVLYGAAVAGAGYYLAWFLGGEGMAARLATLVTQPPVDLYYANRGSMLGSTLKVLVPLYPLGAGMGHWGMTHLYFGSGADTFADSIWVELQWTGWLMDGGIPLVVTYAAAVLASLVYAFRLARRGQPGTPHDVGAWAVVILAFGLGVAAATFNSPVFLSQMGMDFWLLNALLFGAARHRAARPDGVRS